jgi:signal transduction histidine kinase
VSCKKNEIFLNESGAEGDELVFMSEDSEPAEKVTKKESFQFNRNIELFEGMEWKILVVDDEEDIHTVTHLTLDDFEFDGRGLKILDAYSAEEAYQIIRKETDIAIILLDVVMETTISGLELIKRIRKELNNHFVRIVLRTGQPGYAPEREVVINYDINDYKTKTELTSDKIFTLVSSGLRAYNSLINLESYRRDLEKKVEYAIENIREKDHIIIKQSRQAAISELIANLSHQWRQPLNTVMALIQDIEYSGKDINVDYLRQQSEKAMAIIQEMSDTIDDLRYFFQPLEMKDSFNTREVLKHCQKLLEPSLREEQILLKLDNDKDIMIDGYRNDYAQVILQVINNSRDALIERGGSEKVIKVTTKEAEGRSKVEISDNGGGIPEDVIEHIFEPYYSTKFKSPGRGLSLYMCQIVIEKNMAGRIWARNSDEGAIIEIEV